MKFHRFWISLAMGMLFASCTATGNGSHAWSRTYFAPRDDVIDAVIEVLEDEGYFVEADRETGRVTGEPSRSTEHFAALVVSVRRKGDRILVDVLTRGGTSYSTIPSGRSETAVLEFFHDLEVRLRGGRN